MAASVLFVFAFFKGLGFVVWVFFAILEPTISKFERVRRELDARNIATNKIDVATWLLSSSLFHGFVFIHDATICHMRVFPGGHKNHANRSLGLVGLLLQRTTKPSDFFWGAQRAALISSDG